MGKLLPRGRSHSARATALLVQSARSYARYVSAELAANTDAIRTKELSCMVSRSLNVREEKETQEKIAAES